MKAQKVIFGFPKNVFILSLVSLLNDIGGQTIKYSIPLFLTNALGVKTSIIGLIEGIGEATPMLFQPLSGWFSDRLQKRKPFVLFGQFLRSLIVLLFSANSWLTVLLIRFFDRTGKGIQVAPRDALLSASAEKGKQGKAFGLSRALDNTGALLGLILAGIITLAIGRNTLSLSFPVFRLIVLLTIIPMIVAFFLLLFFVSESYSTKQKQVFWRLKDHLNRRFYLFLFIAFIFTLGNSSDAFLILKAQRVGMNLASIFFLLALFSFVAALINIPAGLFSDKFGRKKTIISGWILYAATYFGFAQTNKITSVIILFIFYGVYYGLTEGVAKAFVADIVPENKKGLAFGLYNLVVGGTLLPASFIAGLLWQTFSPAAAFYFGSVLSLLAIVLFILTD